MRTLIAVPTLLRWYYVVRNRIVLKRMSHKVKEITQSADRLRDRSDAELADDYQSLKHLVEQGATPEQLEVDLFALICEQAYRTLSMRPYDVQLLAALLLRRNKIVQMETGEGKTLVAPFQAIIDVLFRHRVTIVTPNDYLSYRDARWMGPPLAFG
jgi:preprotein translocase subunit SecA